MRSAQKSFQLSTFKELGLSEEILKVLSELGFEKPTEIQQKAIPQLLDGFSDFIGIAQTGTGKTAAFGLPLLEQIDTTNHSTQALVLAPTRELGQQIAEQLHTFSKYQDKVNVLAVYGGAAISNQIQALRKTQHVIIATPGRLIDLIKRRAVKLDNLEVLVLDEADEMLNMGFKDELDEILSYTPEEKLTWLFSATMPSFIKKIVDKYMDNPFEIRINVKEQVNTNIKHFYTAVRQSDKTEALTRFLDVHSDMRGIVFCRTRRDTQELAEELLKKNYRADAIHGDLSQAHRDRVMRRFKEHDLQVLIATDVAARGIDVSDITHVFHFTLPDDNSYYTHRSGRTARAGKKGTSIAFISPKETYKINRLAKQLDIIFEKVLIPSTAEIVDIRIENWCEQIINKKDSDKVSPELFEKVQTLFADLSKEDLIKAIVESKLNSLNLGSSRNLNDAKGSDGGGGRRRDRDRGGRGGDRRDRGGNRRNRGGDRDRGGRGNYRGSSSSSSDKVKDKRSWKSKNDNPNRKNRSKTTSKKRRFH